MPVAAYNKVAPSVENLLEGINAGTDSWAIALSNAAPASSAFVAGTTDLATGGGYTAGGNAATVASSVATAGVYKLTLNDPPVWTATGGGFTFRYAILVNSTNNISVGYWDYGSSQVVAAAETVTVDLDATNGVFTVT
jgi:hypothetical protein